MRQWRSGASLSTLRARHDLYRAIRDYFYATGALEVTTPVLAQGVGPEPSIECPRLENQGHYLLSSPEFPMKRLLAQGSGDIFQLAQVFRAGEQGTQHNPEFTMLEWYRVGQTLSDLLSDIDALLSACCGWPPAQRIRYAQWIHDASGIDPLQCTTTEIEHGLMARGIDVPSALSIDALLDLLVSTVVAPSNPQHPLFITHFPASQASLAQLCQHDPRVALRFELYYGSLELANGFQELDDPAEQQQRFEAEIATRAQYELPEVSIDPFFIPSLASLPPCSGVAVGIDRLLMAVLAAPSLDAVQSFSWERV